MELSIEEKAKAYDEAKARMSKAYNDNRCTIGFMNEIFPELKESEDEKIRNFISNELACLRATDGKGSDRYEELTNAIAWLEKQGEHKFVDGTFVNVDDVREDFVQEVYRVLDADSTNDRANQIIDAFDNLPAVIIENQCQTFTKKDVDDAYLKGVCDEKHELEKQGEQNTVVVIPKFKVGDWVVWDNKVSCHVDNIYQGKESLMYTITDVNNMTRSYSVKGFDNNAHIWTIQDAKAGDVLCSGQMILLFKKWEDSDWNFVIAYVGIDISGKLQITNGHWLISNYTHPATKEQRDTLFAKMKEAGYKWDAEKKELKKIEQKPAWSEEDLAIISRVISIVKWAAYSDHSHPILNDEGATELVEWLKSIKGRVQLQNK